FGRHGGPARRVPGCRARHPLARRDRRAAAAPAAVAAASAAATRGASRGRRRGASGRRARPRGHERAPRAGRSRGTLSRGPPRAARTGDRRAPPAPRAPRGGARARRAFRGARRAQAPARRRCRGSTGALDLAVQRARAREPDRALGVADTERRPARHAGPARAPPAPRRFPSRARAGARAIREHPPRGGAGSAPGSGALARAAHRVLRKRVGGRSPSQHDAGPGVPMDGATRPIVPSFTRTARLKRCTRLAAALLLCGGCVDRAPTLPGAAVSECRYAIEPRAERELVLDVTARCRGPRVTGLALSRPELGDAVTVLSTSAPLERRGTRFVVEPPRPLLI